MAKNPIISNNNGLMPIIRHPLLGGVTPNAILPSINTVLPTINPMIPGYQNGAWCIFIYNLEPDTNERDLWQLFGPFGAVQTVSIVRDQQNNRCKGYAFVTMTNYREALLAVTTLNGFTFGKRVLQVSFKTKKPKTKINIPNVK